METMADLLIVNGAVTTMDARKPDAEAIAIRDGVIVSVGRTRDILKLKGRKSKVIDAEGNAVLPGLIEGHMHIFYGGAELSMLSLEGVFGMDAMVKSIRGYDAMNPGPGLLVGHQTAYVILGTDQGLTRHDIDKALPERPVLLYAPDHHTAWANTAALKAAGILNGRKLTPGHEIVMGADGLATGELREPEAIGPVAELTEDFKRARLGIATGGDPEPHVSSAEFEADVAVIQTALAHMAQHGITSFHNMDGNLYQMQLLAALERRGQLTARARVPFHFKPFMPLEALERARVMAVAYQSPMLRAGMVKMFMDGVVDSGTALMLDDYPDKPGWRGEPLFPQAQFNAVATEADRLGLQIAVHAIGDGAVHSVLNGYAAAQKANGKRDSRHRIEHIEVYAPADVARFKRLGVIASMQPPHAPGGQGMPLEPTLTKIGHAKWPHAYGWTRFRKAGVPLVFGTDWPISDVNPLRSIHTSVVRTPWEMGLPNNAQSLEDAIASYTSIGAYAEFAESWKGQVKKGFAADIAVLDRKLSKHDPDTVLKAKPVLTVTAGKIVYKSV
jgi:predicted amidohydrolase YtcJ